MPLKVSDGILLDPKPDEAPLDQLLQKEIEANPMKIIVLDDDPTGVQTVHDVSVYTDWTERSIEAGFRENSKLFYILTNSRAFTAEQTKEAHGEIARAIAGVSKKLRMDYMVMSRSDSTLRGHYPLETETLRAALEGYGERKIDGEIICPSFIEGGRITVNNVHYVRDGDRLVPAGETEFARDRTFGYASSDLCAYVEEKTGGRYKKESVATVSIARIRSMDIDGIARQLMEVMDFNKVVVNAVDYCDIKVFCIALYRAMAAGRRYLFRTAASLVKVMGGINDKPLLLGKDMLIHQNANGGLVVVGSHTHKTNGQMQALRGMGGLEFVAFHAELAGDQEKMDREINRAAAESEALMRSGKTAVIYTNRTLLTAKNETREAALLRSTRISDAVQSLVGRLRVAPSFVVAKGGITSSDIGTKALQVWRADVMGQIKPGVPVWRTGPESRFPGIPFVIFPGNVGESQTLREIVEILLQK